MKRPLFLDQPDAWRSSRTLSNPANDANPFHAPAQTGYPRSWWVTVVVCGLAAVLIVLLTACSVRVQADDQSKVAQQKDGSWETFGPDEFGVRCYHRRLAENSVCLKVTP